MHWTFLLNNVQHYGVKFSLRKQTDFLPVALRRRKDLAQSNRWKICLFSQTKSSSVMLTRTGWVNNPANVFPMGTRSVGMPATPKLCNSLAANQFHDHLLGVKFAFFLFSNFPFELRSLATY